MKILKNQRIENAAEKPKGMCSVLKHVLHDAAGKQLIATNGNILASIPCQPEDGDRDGDLIPVDQVKASRKIADGKSKDFSVKKADSTPPPKQINFPRWQQVVPDKSIYEGGGKIVLRAKDLLDLASALGDNVVVLSLPSDGQAHPIRVTGRHEKLTNGAWGLIMPLSMDLPKKQ